MIFQNTGQAFPNVEALFRLEDDTTLHFTNYELPISNIFGKNGQTQCQSHFSPEKKRLAIAEMKLWWQHRFLGHWILIVTPSPLLPLAMPFVLPLLYSVQLEIMIKSLKETDLVVAANVTWPGKERVLYGTKADWIRMPTLWLLIHFFGWDSGLQLCIQ